MLVILHSSMTLFDPTDGELRKPTWIVNIYIYETSACESCDLIQIEFVYALMCFIGVASLYLFIYSTVYQYWISNCLPFQNICFPLHHPVFVITFCRIFSFLRNVLSLFYCSHCIVSHSLIYTI